MKSRRPVKSTVMLHNKNRSVTESEEIVACFVRGLNVFGRGTLLMSDLRAQCDSIFERSGRRLRVLASHGSTGNILVYAPGIATATIRDLVVHALGNQCAVAKLATLGRIASAFDSWSQPLSEEQERWTRGFALLCDGVWSTKQIDACETGVFKIVDNSTVIVYRRERETRGGTLDSHYRRGGWGAVTKHIEGTLGGTWTARSLSVAEALLSRSKSLG